MDKKLLVQALTKFFAGLFLVAVLVFLPAGTLDYWHGWLFLGVLFFPMTVLGFVLLVKSPELLRKRLQTKEKEGAQKKVVALSGLMFLVGFLLCGLNVRFGWFLLPKWAALFASVVFLIGYGMYGEVLRENAYLARTVEVQEGQKLIDTGLYGVVRHPMYAATILMFLSMPLILGSVISFVIFLAYPLILAKRIRNEEEVLRGGLAGYPEYCNRVKYRMIPYLW